MSDADDPTAELPGLLRAVAAFLNEQVGPAVADPGLGFRARVAAHLLLGASAELAAVEAWRRARAERLARLFPETPDAPAADLEARLAARLRDPATPESWVALARGHVLATLREVLSARNPRFDLRSDIEETR